MGQFIKRDSLLRTPVGQLEPERSGGGSWATGGGLLVRLVRASFWITPLLAPFGGIKPIAFSIGFKVTSIGLCAFSVTLIT